MPLPFLRKQGTSTQLIVDSKPFVMLGGEVHNSSASNLQYMEGVWKKLVAAACNTAIVPICWELFEPEEGRFDFTLLDGVIDGARRHGLKLVLLWFGTWKNGMSQYVPAWIKTDLKRFLRAKQYTGEKTEPVYGPRPNISCVCEAATAADTKAFVTLMRRVREIDSNDQTVIMVQVENETGILGSPRDFSSAANAAFASAVPKSLLTYLDEHKESLHPAITRAVSGANLNAGGTWSDVFRSSADEVFMAWHIARHVERVTAAGKAEYPLPMFVNCWLVQHDAEKPGSYPSGGPVEHMFDVWRAAAPSVDVFAPDIYLPDFKTVCNAYAARGNPLLIPETHRDENAAANAFYALGQHDAICYAPFGIDSMEHPEWLAESYRFLAGMLPVLTRYHGSGQMRGLVQTGDTEELELGNYRLRIKYPRPRDKSKPPGAGLIIAFSPDEFLFCGYDYRVDVLPKPGGPQNVDYIFIEEGTFRSGAWLPGRRMNGDEYNVWLESRPSALRVKLYAHN
jgi:beta-galactosidase GanA